MKRTLPLVMLVCLILLFIPLTTGSWNEVTRLTYSGSAEQHTILADNDDNVHIIFQENLGGRTVLKYQKLDDRGEVLVSTRTVISASGDSVLPAAELDQDGIHLIWWDSRSGNFGLYFTLLNLNGTQVMTERSLDTELADDRTPSEAARTDIDLFGNLYIVWSQQGYNTEGMTEDEEITPSIYFMKIDEKGDTLVPMVRISSGYGNAINPDIELDRFRRAHIVWSEDLTGNYEVYYSEFHDYDQGSTGNPETNIIRLTDTPMESVMSTLLYLDGNLFIAWSDGDDDGDIYRLHLGLITDSGLSMDLVVADRGNAFYPQMDYYGSSIYITWQDDRHSLTGSSGRDAYDNMRDNITGYYSHAWRHINGKQVLDARDDLTNWEIYLGDVDITGTIIENQTRITSIARASLTPRIATSGNGAIKLVWVDASQSSGDLFYVDNNEEELEESVSLINSKEGSLMVVGGIGLLCLIYVFSGQGRRFALYKFLLMPLYSTISKDKIMENANRRHIVALIDSNHGITFTALMDELGLKNGALAYHLYTLERRRYIKSVKDGKFRRFYPRGAQVTGLSSLEERIISVIRTNPSISQREIANLIESTPQTVNYNIKKLIQRGEVYLKKEGKHTRCNLTSTIL